MRSKLLLLPLLLAIPAGAADRFSGPKTCSATDCHGSRTFRPNGRATGLEYTVWSQKDKHAKSIAALSTDRGKAIAAALGVPDPASNARCLSCHGPAGWEAPATQGEGFDATAGTTCDNCHGASGGWWAQHSRTRNEFKAWTHAQSLAAGMRDTEDVFVRANLCLGCHANIDGRLLAAKHPDVTFELDHMEQIMPAHWIPESGSTRVRAFATGQLLALREALIQLEAKSRDDAVAIVQGDALVCALLAKVLGAPAALLATLEGLKSTKPPAPPYAAARQALEALAKQAATAPFPIATQRQLLRDLAAAGPAAVPIGYRGAEAIALSLLALNSALEAAHEASPAMKPAIVNVLRYAVARERYAHHEVDFQKALSAVRALLP